MKRTKNIDFLGESKVLFKQICILGMSAFVDFHISAFIALKASIDLQRLKHLLNFKQSIFIHCSRVLS